MAKPECIRVDDVSSQWCALRGLVPTTARRWQALQQQPCMLQRHARVLNEETTPQLRLPPLGRGVHTRRAAATHRTTRCAMSSTAELRDERGIWSGGI